MARGGATVLVVVASLLLAATTLAAYARLALFDADGFANRAAASLQDPGVRAVIGERVTDRLVLTKEPDLIAARPLISSAVSGIVGAPAFRGLLRRAVLDAHRAIFTRDRDTLTLTLADVGTVAAAAIEKLNPKLSSELDAGRRVVLLERNLGGATGDVVRLGDRLRVLAYVLALLTVAAGAAAVVVSPDRRRTVAQLGLGMVAAGVAIVVAYTVGRAIATGSIRGPEEQDAAAGVWDAFLGGLRTLGWLLAACGAVVAAAAASLIAPIEVEGPLRAAWRGATTDPDATWLRLLRAAALVVGGLLLIYWPLALAGVYLLYKGLETVLRVIQRPAPERPERRRPSARRLVVPVLALALIGLAVGGFALAGGAEAPAAQPITECNGSAALCDRPLDEVVLPATHNSMSAPLPGWFSAEQERSIGGQLDDGIRGLLLDTHYGDRLASGRVRTYFNTADDRRHAVTDDAVSPAAIESALRLRDRLGFRGPGTRGLYLCHTFCELGATLLADGLRDIHEFLATHPAEVVMVVNQDYVTPPDFVRAVFDAGLEPYAFEPPAAGKPWPTLRQMIERGERLVLLAENHAGAAPWYQLAYERLTEETPFHFGTAAALLGPPETTCAPHRGPAGAPLFLINHWVTTAPVQRPSDAAKVNAYGPLLARSEACMRIRDHLPNLLAVNFYKEGDVFRVADRLNRVPDR